MENKNFPPLGPENSLPEQLPEAPKEMEPLKEADLTDLFPEETTPMEISSEETPDLEEAVSEMPQVEELIFNDLPEAEEAVSPIPSSEIPEENLPDYAAPAPWSPEEQPAAQAEISEPEAGSVSETSEALPVSDDTAFALDLSAGSFLPEELPEEEAYSQVPAAPDSRSPQEPEPEEEILDQEYRDDGLDFDNLFDTAPRQTEAEAPDTSAFTQKGRPKRKKGEGLLGIPSILATFVWLALIVLIGVTAGRMLWLCAADVLAFGREDQVVTVTIYEADTMEDIIDKLHEKGLIRYKSLFSLYADISDAEEDIKPGIYDLNTRYDYHALVNFMSPRSSREVIQLTIPEGYTCRQIFSLLEENRICTAVDAASYAADGELSDYWFLEGVQRGTDNCLEGYLFPDTYEFYKNSTPREALERMLDNFAYRFDEELVAQIDAINGKFGCDYTVREIVIIASLIEKESAAPGESPMVSGVIYNRLFDWGNNPPYLNIDASIVYAQGGDNEKIDTSLDSPYNTYAYEGLTPGPIANPGLSSLKAALNPEDHNYYYYVLNPSTGMHQFSTTYEEHTGYVRQFAEATEGQ